MESPATALKETLPKSIALTSHMPRVIAGSVSFDGKNVSTRMNGVTNRKVDTVLADSHLGDQLQTPSSQFVTDVDLKGVQLRFEIRPSRKFRPSARHEANESVHNLVALA
jgi:hypothetical protein